MTEKTDKHLGKFVGGYLNEEQLKKIDEMAKLMDGDPSRNRTRALRYIIDCFNPEWGAYFPKSQPSVGVNAQAVMNN